jgi:UDP-N-acetyl-D-glucosamine dehydrogenase
VSTPLTKQREHDLSFVEKMARAITERLRRSQHIVLESTIWPGTTDQVMKPIIEATGLRSGFDFFWGFSPEREDPGNQNFSMASIPKAVGGDGNEALEIANALYVDIIVKTAPVSSSAMAEAVKLTEKDIFRSVSIALVNELKVIFDAMGVDVWEVIDAAKTKPFRLHAMLSGPGSWRPLHTYRPLTI